MTADAAEEDPSVILGNVRVNSVPATVLFDSGASHTFISEAFAKLHKLNFEKLPTPLVIHSPGSSWRTSSVSHGNMIEIGFLWFPTSFLVLNSNDIDVIVGMNWLSQYHANIDCADRSVTLTHPSGDIIQYWSPSSVYPSEVPLAQADFYALEAIPPLDIQDVQVVCDFPDVFPEELPGMPPDREVEFVIELVPGTAPISKRPYRMPREELAELKNTARRIREQRLHPA